MGYIHMNKIIEYFQGNVIFHNDIYLVVLISTVKWKIITTMV